MRQRRAEQRPTPLMEVPPRYVGQSIGRIEDRPLLMGTGAFVDDVDRPGQLHARIVRSPVAHGRIRAIDTEAALRRADVVAVLTAADLPAALRIPIRLAPTPLAARALQPPLARDVVRYAGEPLAVVVATSPYAAEDAAAEVDLDIDERPALVDTVGATGEGATELHEGVPANTVSVASGSYGADVSELFARADVVVRERLTVQRHGAVPLETRGLVAEFDAGSRRLTVWGPTKVKHYNRRILATMLELDPERVRFVEPDVGGGFGARGEFYPEDLLIPWLALALGRPVKWVEDRQEHFVATNHSREQECVVEVAASADGRLLALRARAWVDLGAYVRTNSLVLAKNTVRHLPGPYMWEGFEAEALGVLTTKTPAGTYRGPGQYEPAFHRERVLDLVAGRLGVDPFELRRRNLVPGEAIPHTLELRGTEEPVLYDSGDFPLLWDRMGAAAGLDGLRDEVAARRSAGESVGIGTAAFVEAGGTGPYEWASVVPEHDGTFTVHVGSASLGQGIATALSQIAADALQVPLDKVRLSHRDTDSLSDGAGSFSSRSTLFAGNAVAGAVDDLLASCRTVGAERLGISVDEVEVVAGGIVRLRGDHERALTFADLGCRAEHRYEKHTRGFSMGGALAVAAVDDETGAVTVERCIVACDVGRAVNPRLVDGQLVGAAAQGLGGALLEALVYDAQGQPVATSFMDYCLPTAVEVPAIEAVVLELASHRAPEESNPLGVKGAGEGGIVGIGAAVANAVGAALGDGGPPILRLPLAPGDLCATVQPSLTAP